MAKWSARKPARERYERLSLVIPSAPDAGLFVLLYPVKRWPVAGSGMGSHVGSDRMREGDEYRTVHVISPHAGGEVRGYVLTGGTLRLRLPSTPTEWPEVDAAVRLATGAERVESAPERRGGWEGALAIGTVVDVGPAFRQGRAPFLDAYRANDGHEGVYTVVGYMEPDYKLIRDALNGSIASQCYVDGDYDILIHRSRVTEVPRG